MPLSEEIVSNNRKQKNIKLGIRAKGLLPGKTVSKNRQQKSRQRERSLRAPFVERDTICRVSYGDGDSSEFHI